MDNVHIFSERKEHVVGGGQNDGSAEPPRETSEGNNVVTNVVTATHVTIYEESLVTLPKIFL